MTKISDGFVLERMDQARRTQYEPQFSLGDLVGKTVESTRKIKNPEKYNPQTSSPNPEYFDLVLFSDDTFLLSRNWGDCECAHVEFYYFDGSRTLYSDSLFGLT